MNIEWITYALPIILWAKSENRDVYKYLSS
jgi:hypothetical protein